MLLYWRPRYRYAEHLLFFVHLLAFYFSVAILMLCLTMPRTRGRNWAGWEAFSRRSWDGPCRFTLS